MTIRWVLILAGLLILFLAGKESVTFLLGRSAIRRSQLLLRLSIALLFLATLGSIEIGLFRLPWSTPWLVLLYWLFAASLLIVTLLLVLVDVYMSKRWIEEEAKGFKRFPQQS
jgi:hypothetical protein